MGAQYHYRISVIQDHIVRSVQVILILLMVENFPLWVHGAIPKGGTSPKEYLRQCFFDRSGSEKLKEGECTQIRTSYNYCSLKGEYPIVKTFPVCMHNSKITVPLQIDVNLHNVYKGYRISNSKQISELESVEFEFDRGSEFKTRSFSESGEPFSRSAFELMRREVNSFFENSKHSVVSVFREVGIEILFEVHYWKVASSEKIYLGPGANTLRGFDPSTKRVRARKKILIDVELMGPELPHAGNETSVDRIYFPLIHEVALERRWFGYWGLAAFVHEVYHHFGGRDRYLDSQILDPTCQMLHVDPISIMAKVAIESPDIGDTGERPGRGSTFKQHLSMSDITESFDTYCKSDP